MTEARESLGVSILEEWKRQARLKLMFQILENSGHKNLQQGFHNVLTSSDLISTNNTRSMTLGLPQAQAAHTLAHNKFQVVPPEKFTVKLVKF